MQIEAADFLELLALTKLLDARLQVVERRQFAMVRMMIAAGFPLPPGWNDDTILDQAMAQLKAAQTRRNGLRSSVAVIPFERA